MLSVDKSGRDRILYSFLEIGKLKSTAFADRLVKCLWISMGKVVCVT